MRFFLLFTRDRLFIVAVIAAAGLCNVADAQDSEGPEPLADETISAWDHFELSMGFIAGSRRYGELTYEGSQRYASMLDSAPFDDALVFGLRYDLRLVVSYVRMTVGVDIPFPTFDSAATTVMIDGMDTTLTQLRGWNLHFGIGGEYPVGPVAPFLDILGDVGFAEAQFSSAAGDDTLNGRGFGFALRGGVRLHVRKWFFASASAEVGLVGDIRWGTELSVGFALM